MIDLDSIKQRVASLTSAQTQVLGLLFDGLSNAKVAAQLGVTIHTVKAHRLEIMKRMKAASFAELIALIQQYKSADEAPRRSADKPLHVLVVEDDDWYRDYLINDLNQRDFNAEGVASSQEFFRRFAELPADVVVLDIELGNDSLSGLDIAKHLAEKSSCGVIMVTCRGEQADRLTGLQLGVDSYFSKPINVDELALTIANLGRRL